ncbi:putative baseplate assembly protein [Roseibium marinum]|uniref:Putative phage baseplate assembly protein n=1 Tax=Roseibium marinum TaxID=281252 RepID=A0A2S3UN17_9HYPH|nr:putative baseplate assembly protein [Roseibium marinum]POF29081.1 putative phage baseplate assembly protein [Roseibium marinum]
MDQLGTSPPTIDYTAVDFDSLDAALRELAARNLPEYTDQSDNDIGALLRQYVAYAADIALYYQTRIAQNLMPSTGDDPEALTQLLRWIGYERAPATAATAEVELAFDASIVPPLILPIGTGFSFTASSGQTIRFELTRDVTITATDLGNVDASRSGLRYALPFPVIEGRTTSGEEIGRADGSANQLYALSQPNVLPGSVRLTVSEAGGPRVWQEVETLLDSGPTDRHFIIRRAANGIASALLGDGVNGYAPPAGSLAVPATILADYRTGGGPAGNIPARSTLRPELALIRGATTLGAAGGGRAAENLDVARRFAPRLFRAQDRAVSRADYEDLALSVPGIGKARAVAAGWNSVALFLAPQGQVAEPSETLRANVAAMLEPRRILGTELRLLPPDIVEVYIRARVRPGPFMPRNAVRDAVISEMERFFAFDAVDFGEPLYLSRLYDRIQSLAGVDFLFIDRFTTTQNGGVDGDGVVELTAWQLPRPYRGTDGLPLELVMLEDTPG